MIAAQMLACHDAAMECYAAQDPAKDCPLEDQLHYRMKYRFLGSRPSHAFAMLLDALDYHRGKGQRRVMIEHVSVHAGGQAVVGNVRVQRRSTGDCSQIPQREDSAPVPPLSALRSKKQKQKRRAVQAACNGERTLPVSRWQDATHAERQ